MEGDLLALVREGEAIPEAREGEMVEVLLPRTGFYAESGGQVDDTGRIFGESWEIHVTGMRKPAAGVLVHIGTVVKGTPRVGEKATAEVDIDRRRDIMRNHTATHLLHAALHKVLGEHARQAGSLVAPEHLRFDFNHPQALTAEELAAVEAEVNRAIYADMPVTPRVKSREEAIAEGAMALFGEKYGETVRTITIGESHSYELCGGTHLDRTGVIGMFLITSEGSAAAGVRRIEAVTGRGAYARVRERFATLEEAAALLETPPDALPRKVDSVQRALADARKESAELRRKMSESRFLDQLADAPRVKGVPVLAALIPDSDPDTLRQLTDKFREKYPDGAIVLGTVKAGRPLVVAAVAEPLTKRGIHAGKLVQFVAKQLGGGGGGRPTFAQAGGKDASRLEEALASARTWIEEHLA